MNIIPNLVIVAKLTGFTVAFLAIGCDSNPASTRPVVKPISPIADKSPDFVFTPEDFFREVDANRTAAAKKYKGKVIQLTGVLHKILKSATHKVILDLQVPDHPDHIFDIQCYTTDQEPWTTAVPLQIVTIKGRFPDEVVTPELEDCVILNVTGEIQTVLAIQELAKAYAADPKGVMERYYDTCLIVSGVVASKVEEEGVVGDVHVAFETGSNMKFIADFLKFQQEADRLQVGEAARIIGRFRGDKFSGVGVLEMSGFIYAGPGK